LRERAQRFHEVLEQRARRGGHVQLGGHAGLQAQRPLVRAQRLRIHLDGGDTLLASLAAASAAAEAGMRATVPMLARKGRASYLGERSIGHQDPGATSAAIIVAALERAVAGAR